MSRYRCVSLSVSLQACALANKKEMLKLYVESKISDKSSSFPRILSPIQLFVVVPSLGRPLRLTCPACFIKPLIKWHFWEGKIDLFR